MSAELIYLHVVNRDERKYTKVTGTGLDGTANMEAILKLKQKKVRRVKNKTK